MNSKSTKAVKALFTAAFLCLALCGSLVAQELTANLNGTVRDANGAVVPGATVTLRDPSKNDNGRTVKTNEDGEYTFPSIAVSTYDLTIESSGFKKNIVSGVKVDLGARRTLDVTLEAGNVAETVTVEANPVAIDLQSATSGTVISGDQVRELSVNNRNWVQLVTLAPGVSNNLSDQVYVGTTNPEGQANTVPISVNGARSSQNTYTVDGADITDRGSNLTIQAYPSVDSISEFRVLRSLYPAESGRSGGGQVNVITRSGSNSFHGSLFEFVRNEKFNANSFFNNQRAPSGIDSNGKAIRPPFRYNNYGFTIGGPIYFLNFGEKQPGEGYFGKMPKTYFFFSEEQRKDRRFPTLTSSVPDAAVRAGIFPVPICLSGTINGTTRTCSSILPAGTPLSSLAAVNPVAQQYLTNIYNKIALPNNPSIPYQLVAPSSGRADFQQEIIKIDTSFTDKLSASYRYQRDKIPTIDINSLFSSGSSIPGVSTSQTDSPGRTHTFQMTYVFSPNFILEGRYTYAYGAILSSTIGTVSKAGSPGINVPLPYVSGDDRVPAITGIGFNNLVAFGPYDNFSDKNDYSTNATWTMGGNHIMKFGAEFSKYRKNENALGGANQGSFSGFLNTTAASVTQGTVCISSTTNLPIACPAGNQTTLQNFANFLLGNNTTFTQSKYDLTADFRQRNFEAYAQDEFKARKNLTLYLGVRYSFFGSPWDRNGLLSNFDPTRFNSAAAPLVTGAGNRVVGSGNFCNGIIVNTQNYQTGPASYNCTPLASPFGQYVVDVPKNNFAPRVGLAWDPFSNGKTSIRTGYGIFHEQTLVGTFEQNMGANPPYQETITVSQVPLNQPVTGSPAVVASASPPGAIRGVETDFTTPYMQHWSLEWQQQVDNNTTFSIGYFGSKGTHLIGISDINNLRPGFALTQLCATGASTTPTVACQQKDAATQAPIPFTAAALILDQIRPFRGWRGIAMIQPRFNSNYHSMQIAATHRFTGSSQAQLAYTWSKNLTDNQTDRSTAPQNVYDIPSEYGRAQLDRRHILTANYIYELPFWRRQEGVVGKILGGWQSSGIVTYQTGLPFTPTFGAFDPAGLGILNASSPAGGRPFQYGDPNTGAPNTQQQFFNTSAFQTTTFGLFPAIVGSAGRGVIEGPRTFRIDFSMMKNFRFSERMSLQLRGEAFNVLNMTNFTTLALAASTPSTFGTVTATRDPRTLQFGVKFYF